MTYLHHNQKHRFCQSVDAEPVRQDMGMKTIVPPRMSAPGSETPSSIRSASTTVISSQATFSTVDPNIAVLSRAPKRRLLAPPQALLMTATLTNLYTNEAAIGKWPIHGRLIKNLTNSISKMR